MIRKLQRVGVVVGLLLTLEKSFAVEFESLAQALAATLKEKKQVLKNSVTVRGRTVDYYMRKDVKPDKATIAFVQKEVYDPNCTHTWVIGVDSSRHRVTSIREVEMSCPHAFPTRQMSFKSQFLGKTRADIPKMKDSIDFIAKATGSSELLRDSIVRSIEGSAMISGQGAPPKGAPKSSAKTPPATTKR